MDKGCYGPQASCQQQQQQQQQQATSVLVQEQPSSHQKQPAEQSATEQPPSIAQLQLQVSNPLLNHAVEQPTSEATE